MKKVAKDVASEQLFSDFKTVVADAEALIKATASQGDEKLAEIRGKAEESLKMVKARMAGAQMDLVAETGKAAKATNAYVHDNPWQSMGVAAGIGLAIGCLLSHR